MDLFASAGDLSSLPLAARMRPRTLDEFAGQDHIIGPGRLLRRAIQADQLSSVIFSGPPGSGKTTLARIIANTTKSSFVTLNAVLSGVKDIRGAIEEARKQKEFYDKKTILFVDEVHRWNKAQQDALLPWVENGIFILIGATTENPYFEVNSALVSRSRIFQLKTLNDEDLRTIAGYTLADKERGYGKYDVRFKDGALEHLVKIAAGDARSLLNALELAVETTPSDFPPADGKIIEITLEAAEESIQKKVVLYDKEGDYHFDTISAFIKSLRGSDPDAALYWLARMIRAGEEPKYIFRRMLILASEDIGLADPQALVVTEAAAAAYERVGLPEGQFHLAQAVLYLASAPKSNSTLGYFDALAAVEEEEQDEVPTHLKDGNRDKKGFGHGEGYLYPHAYRNHWIAQQYLPIGLKGKVFYKPSGEGYEKEIHSRVLRRREAQLEAVIDNSPGEILTYSPANSNREAWLNRISRGVSTLLEEIREEVFTIPSIQRHHRILVLKPGGGLLLWEALRRVPEGAVWSLVSDKEGEILSNYSETLAELERPVLVHKPLEDAFKDSPESIFGDIRFEAVVGRNVLTRSANKKENLEHIHSFLEGGGILSLAETIPGKSQRLSALLPAGALPDNSAERFRKAEKLVYHNDENILVNWDEDDLCRLCREAGYSKVTFILKEFTETRVVGKQDLHRWLDPESTMMNYGRALEKCFPKDEKKSIIDVLHRELLNKEVSWKSSVCFLQSLK